MTTLNEANLALFDAVDHRSIMGNDDITLAREAITAVAWGILQG